MIQESFVIVIFKGEIHEYEQVAVTSVGVMYPSSTQVAEAIKAHGGSFARVDKIHVLINT